MIVVVWQSGSQRNMQTRTESMDVGLLQCTHCYDDDDADDAEDDERSEQTFY